MFAPGLLAGKRIVVTGGGTGLGAAMAARFGQLGASLVLCGRRADVLEATAAGIRAHGARGGNGGTDANGENGPDGGNGPDGTDGANNATNATNASVRTAVCDVRDAAAVESLVDTLWAEAPIDVWVNNAAATFIARSETLSHRAADAVLATTLHGALYGTLAIGKRWIASGRTGTVLSILSTSTITGRAFTVPSAMAKAGVLAMTRSLAVEWGPKGIRLVAIAPGPFPTAGADRQLNPGARDASAARAPLNPLGRVGRPSELADLASYLVSDAASYVNGEMVVIDGGAHLRTSGAEDLLQWSAAEWDALRSTSRR